MPPRIRIEEVESALARREAQQATLEGRPARAGVAMILESRADDLYVFFIHRAVDERDPWSGHMGFPGGFMDPGDADLLATVHREVQEEVGIDLAVSARAIGRLDEIQGVARGRQLPLVISPFLFALEKPVRLRPNEEVQGTLWVPLSFLSDPANESTIEYRIDGQPMKLPAFLYGERTIWGLTFRMAQNFLAVLGRRPG